MWANLADGDSDNGLEEPTAELSVLSSACRSFVAANELDDPTRDLLDSMPESIQEKAAMLKLTSRIRNKSAYVTKAVRGMVKQLDQAATSADYDYEAETAAPADGSYGEDTAPADGSHGEATAMADASHGEAEAAGDTEDANCEDEAVDRWAEYEVEEYWPDDDAWAEPDCGWSEHGW